MLCYAKLYYYTIPLHTMPYHIISYHIISYHIKPYPILYIILFYAILFLLYYTMLYCTILCFAVLYWTRQDYTALYTIHHEHHEPHRRPNVDRPNADDGQLAAEKFQQSRCRVLGFREFGVSGSRSSSSGYIRSGCRVLGLSI